MGKLVEVVVAPRKSIHLNGGQIPGTDKNSPGVSFGPGSKVMVDESELPRLFKQGFIIDPHAKTVTADEVAAADLSAYVPNEGEPVMISEKSDQQIRRGRA